MTNYNNNVNPEEKKSITGWLIGGAAIVALAIGAVVLTDIDLTSTGSLPEVSVEAGEMPSVDVDVADVDLGTKTITKTIEVEVPTVDIDLPKEGQEADDLADNIDLDVDVDVEPEK